MIRPTRFCLLFFLFAAFAGASETKDDASKLFQSGLQAYESGNYPQATQLWEQVWKSGVESAGIHLDLGNAFYRSGKLGQAIFHFRKAWELEPRDPDIRYNLDYSRSKVEDKIETKNFTTRFHQWLPFSQKEAYYFLGLASVLFWTIAVVCLFKRYSWLKWTRTVSFGIFVLAIFLLAAKLATTKPFGTVAIAEAEVYSDISADKILLFRLHEGDEFSIENRMPEGWLQIALADGKKGWLKAADAQSDPS